MNNTDKKSIIDEIKHLKNEKDAVILVHNYQRPEIQDIADYMGDSLDLSRKAANIDCKIIVFCGVKFMAESAKILSPEKTVLLPRKDAGCPMADMVTVAELRELKAKHPDAIVVSYVNTNADVKAESDVCCTSANAVKVVQSIKSNKIIFTPDRNLGSWVQRFTDKDIILWDGYCYVHQGMNPRSIKLAKGLHPNAKLIVHPECRPQVIDLADEVLSTSGMIRFAKESATNKILIGTEEGILYRLKRENPDKTFYAAGPARVCRSMKVTKLEDVLIALKEKRYKIEIPEFIREKAKKALEEMLKYI
ncbi:quinolinate synthase NadA [candidate division WOR-3 bacterium]|nr:quinolinate synthase NadA [candidate division WOR-3 bacterium]